MDSELKRDSGPSEALQTEEVAPYSPPTLTKSGHMAAVTQKSGAVGDGGSGNYKT